MTGPAEFYAARLDEKEAKAWAVHDVSKCDALLYEDLPASAPLPDAGDCECGYPARVLREVAADRRLLAAWQEAEAERLPFEPEYAYGIRDGRAEALLLAVKIRAAVWRDHPDFDPGWLSWTGWRPGGDGHWRLTVEEFRRPYSGAPLWDQP